MNKKIIILLMGIFLLTGCSSNKEIVEDYLKENDYKAKNNCLQKTEKDESIQFCMEECKVYATDTSLDDYFMIDLKEQKVTYIYSYITYQYDITEKKKTCLWQGEEIDNESSYCTNAWKGFEIHYQKIEDIFDKANVMIKYSCK